MKKNIFFIWLILLVGFFSGCSFSGKPDGGIYKTEDGGKSFQQKNWINEKANLDQVNIFSLAINPEDPRMVYAGTENAGLFRTINGGDSWEKDSNDFKKITSIVLNPYDPKVIYIATVFEGRGKIFKTFDEGENWEEIYTEKNNGPYILSLAIDKNNPDVIYAGNSLGGIFRSDDQGQSWKTLLWAESLIKTIVLDNINSDIVYVGTTSTGLLISKNRGKDFEEIISSGNIYALSVDPQKEGKIFVSNNNGLQVSDDFGRNWATINTLVKPENLYSRGLAINPYNDQEIYYSSGEALYKSIDQGKSWTPIQFNFNRIIGTILINSDDTDIIYLGTRKNSNNAFQLIPTNL